jgi:hypothetical protein
MSAILPKMDTLSICEICRKTWRVSLSIGVRITIIRCVVYLLRIFKMFHGIMNNPVLLPSGQYLYLYLIHSESSSKLIDHHKIGGCNYVVLAIRNVLFISGVSI